MIVGNTEVWARLSTELPTVALLTGRPGLGKWTGASEIAAENAAIEDVVRFQDMTVADADQLTSWLRLASSKPRYAIVEPGNCHANVWYKLKSLAEQVVTPTHLWIIASNPPEALKDRCFHYCFSALTGEEILTFLEESNTVAGDIEIMAAQEDMEKALLVNSALNVKSAVANWVRAVEESNRDLLATATEHWERRHTALLLQEIEAQSRNESLLHGVEFHRVVKPKVVRSLSLLSGNGNPRLAAIGVGLSLMPRS